MGILKNTYIPTRIEEVYEVEFRADLTCLTTAWTDHSCESIHRWISSQPIGNLEETLKDIACIIINQYYRLKTYSGYPASYTFKCTPNRIQVYTYNGDNVLTIQLNEK